MWKSGEIIAWKELYRERVWHAVSTIVIKDTPQEVVLAIIPGADRLIEEHYPQGKK